ncbi:MAG: hypothetical protein HYX78_11295 [Armatimonadetes bacterium]|nr:hypothetical protein [Armatimonadota bacterium]
MRLNGHTIRLVLTITCPCVLLPAMAAAQALSPSDSTAMVQPASADVTDILIGKGAKGPYFLSWKNIESEGETVIVSGRKLMRGPDYTIDPASGTVAFAESVPQDAIVRITYRQVPGKSTTNGGGIDLPVNMRLLDRDDANLDVLGFYKAGDGKSSPSGSGVIGLSGGMKLGENSDFTSMFMINQGDSNQPNKGVLPDRSAMKLGTQTSVGGLLFKGSFARVGEQFAGSKQYGLQHAKELLDLAAVWGKESDVVSASFTYKEQEDLGGAQKGTAQTTSEQKVVLNLPSAPKLTLSHTTNEKEHSSGASSGISTDAIQLEQTFGAKTTAVAAVEKSELTSGQSKDNVDTTRVGLHSTAIDKVELRGGIAWKESEQYGSETGIDVGVKAAPGNRVKIDANFSNVNSELRGEQTKTAVKVVSNPLDRVDLVADYTSLNAQTGGQTATAVKMTARPMDRMKLEASYSGKQFDQRADEAQRAVRLEAQPASYIKVSAGMAQKDTGDLQDTNQEARLEIAPSDKLRIATAYRETNNGQSVTTIRDYSGQVKPAEFLQVSGAYKNRESTSAEELNTTSLGLALEPFKTFKITGQYARNPEDKKGNIQRLNSASLGLQMRLGVFGISGGYSEREEYMAGLTSLEKEVGVHVPMFGHGRLTTGLKMAEAVQLAEQSTVTYSIGYTHIIGSSFSLSLAGELTRYEQDLMLQQEEYKATAKLGLKF